ncbi:MAG: hypothetical protein IT193_06655 [Propionibacteriaceae bacterium]|nr:hypothetical protein [Propionibacteriaceae bacterium]
MTPQPGPRTVSVAPERLDGWLAGFQQRHGRVAAEVSPDRVLLLAPDGATAGFNLVWGPLPEGDPLAGLVGEFVRARRVGALIARQKAHAVGVFDGALLVAGRHGSHYVQGRTKAGGWSQQRYARRRANQAGRSFDAAAEDVAELLLPELGRLEALMVGGDRTAVAAVLAHPDLAGLAELRARHGSGVLSVPDPNAGVLAGFGAVFRRVGIELNQLA